MHCHGSLQLGVKIPESLVCSMRWRGVDNAPADADPALASLARKVVALGRILLGRGQRLALTSRTAPPAGVARTVAQELWGVRRNPSAYSTHPSGALARLVLGLILLRNLASFCQNTQIFQSMVELYNSARITSGGAVDDGVLQDMLCFSPRETIIRSSISSLSCRLAIRLRSTSTASCKISAESGGRICAFPHKSQLGAV